MTSTLNTLIPMSSICADHRAQPRATMAAEVCAEYATAMASGAVFPPVVVFTDGATHWLADGFHRYGAAKIAGLTSISAEVRKGELRDAILYSCNANGTHGLRRTNDDKRRAVKVLLSDPEWSRWSDREIARRAGVSHQYVCNMRASLSTVDSERTYTTKHGTEATMDTARIGKADAQALAEAALMQPEEPGYLIPVANTEEMIPALLESARMIRREVATRREDERKAEIKAAEWPTDKYRVIYADPPWSYGNAGLVHSAAQQYETMPLDEICALPVAELATDDAVLFLWATSPLLDEAFQVIRSWGFTYKSSFIWDKQRPVFGFYNRMQHEFLLVAVRGACHPDGQRREPSVISMARDDRHSAKPEFFRAMIDEMYPAGPRIELFSRSAATGWATYGNEAEHAA